VIRANDNNDVNAHANFVQVFSPPDVQHQQQQPGDADPVTSPSRCDVAMPGLLELKPFSHAQPVFYNQAQCIPLYGQYTGQYERYRETEK